MGASISMETDTTFDVPSIEMGQDYNNYSLQWNKLSLNQRILYMIQYKNEIEKRITQYTMGAVIHPEYVSL